jgi:RluA family pseudouridine synthase
LESRQVHLQVEPAEQLERLDLFLARRVRSLPRTLLQRLIRDGHVLLDDRPARRPAQRVGFIRQVRITVPAVEPDEPPLLLPPARVLLNDGWLLAIDKPAGYPVVGKLARAGEDVVRAARRLLGKDDAFVGPCHRLDRDTSGVLLLALRPDAAAALGRAFVRGEVRKTYAALVETPPDPPKGAVDLPIHAPGDDFPSIDAARGRPARTLYRTVASVGGPAGGALVLLRPLTGRTHQLRLHLSALSRPIRGDRLHGGAPADRLHLHAWSLVFPHPATGLPVRLRARLPALFGTRPRGGCEGGPASPD